MMEARHNQITRLTRITFGPLTLDPALAPGEWRMLTEGEMAELESAALSPATRELSQRESLGDTAT